MVLLCLRNVLALISRFTRTIATRFSSLLAYFVYSAYYAHYVAIPPRRSALRITSSNGVAVLIGR